MQRVENNFAFVQNRQITDPYTVAINSLFISLFGTLECCGKACGYVPKENGRI